MPQYVSLAQQGFWQPYQTLAENTRYQEDRAQHKSERSQDVAYRNMAHADELAQHAQENTRANRALGLQEKIGLLNLDEGNLNLDTAKRKYGQQKAIENFDINSLNVTPPAGVPPMIARPTATVNPRALFAQQDPAIQQGLSDWAKKNQIPFDQAASLFQRQQAAYAGIAPAPITPPGMRITKYSVGEKGPEYEARPSFSSDGSGMPALPPGYTYVPNPETGMPEVKKSEIPNEQIVNRLQSLDTLEQQMNMLDKNLKAMPAGSNLPLGMGWLRRNIPAWAPYGSAVPAAANANVAAMGPDIYRGLLNQTGIFSEHAQKEVDPMIPRPEEPSAVQKKKMEQLRQLLGEARHSTTNTAAQAGYDTRGFKPFDLGSQMQLQPLGGAGGARPKFASLDEARRASLPRGTEVEVPDPKTGQYIIIRKN